MQQKDIGFIGGGNMASSLVGGLIAGGADPDALWVTEPVAAKRQALRQRFGIHATASIADVVANTDTLVFAVKPQVMPAVVRALASAVSAKRPLLISIAAGVREPDIRRWVGFAAAIVRCMPNTPALVGSGATALYANTNVSQEQRERAESVLRAVGTAIWVDDEGLLDAVTALSGSGPAYFFLLTELLEKAGCQLGLPAETARALSLQTAYGAAKMALESEHDPATLRVQVTSPGGTTERALAKFQEGGLEALVLDAVAAARDRSVELGEQLGKE
ncbi:MAG: pyrroline-5-carboxylate reductase [Gammaproteobacteria bacterium]|nr:MAG: pyrroline-5-carboxylate reductase [Gammaproteobacteria bacterium]